MGKRGPVPKKKFLKVMSGNLPLKQENGSPEEILNFIPPERPEHLSGKEIEIWDKTVALLKPLAVLEKIDGAVLEAYCCSYVRWVTAENEIKKLTKTGKTSGLLAMGAAGGLIINPLVNISRRALSDTVAYAAQLAMTPAARLRIKIDDKPDGENPFERLKNDKGKNNRLDAKGNKLRQIVDAERE